MLLNHLRYNELLKDLLSTSIVLAPPAALSLRLDILETYLDIIYTSDYWENNQSFITKTGNRVKEE